MHALVRVVALLCLVPVVAVAGDEPKDGAAAAFDAAGTQRLLVSDDPAQRRAACELLKGRWKEAAAFIPALVFALDDESEDVRKAAAATLDGMGTRAAGVLDGFLEVLERGDPPPVAPLPLLGAWDDPGDRPFQTDKTLDQLLSLGRAVTQHDASIGLRYRGGMWRHVGLAIVAGLRVADGSTSDGMPPNFVVPYASDATTGDLATATLAVRGRAAAVVRHLVAVGTPPAAIGRWSSRVQSKRSVVRRLAALYLALWGPAGEPPVDALRKALAALPPGTPPKSRDAAAPHDVTVCIAALRSMGTVAKSAEPEIARHAVAGHVGALELLFHLVPSESLKRWFPGGWPEDVLWAFGEMPTPPPELRPLLEKAVREDAEPGRGTAARLLARLGGDATELVAILDREAKSDEECAIAACRLTGFPEARVAALSRWIEEDGIGPMCDGVIPEMGPRAAPLGPAYVRALKDSSPIWFSAYDALLALGPAAKDAVPLLVRDAGASYSFEEAPWDHRSLSLLALERIGPDAAAARDLLKRLRSDPQPWIAYLAARAERAVMRK